MPLLSYAGANGAALKQTAPKGPLLLRLERRNHQRAAVFLLLLLLLLSFKFVGALRWTISRGQHAICK